MALDLLLLLALFVLNGVFAMSEIAIVSARRARLQQMAEAGSGGAARALDLAAEPTRFLSSVQVGITCIGILSGAVGEASIAAPIRGWLEHVPVLAPHGETLALLVMVACLTFASLIVGELVPKRLAMAHPERIATIVSRPVQAIGRLGRPVVHLLSVTTDAVLRLMRVRTEMRPGVTVDEIRLLLQQGADEGVVEATEHTMVSNVLGLDDRTVGSVATYRADVVFLDVRASREAIIRTPRTTPHTALPLCDGGLDHVVGVVRSARVLDRMLDGHAADLRALAEPPLVVPETMSLMQLLERLKAAHLPLALVVDEFGGVEGLVTLADVTDALIGRRQAPGDGDPLVLRRDEHSWLVDGSVSLTELEQTLGVDLLAASERKRCHTLGGLAMLGLGRLPRTGDRFTRAGVLFEVVDMDGTRVDRVLVSRPGAEGRAAGLG